MRPTYLSACRVAQILAAQTLRPRLGRGSGPAGRRSPSGPHTADDPLLIGLDSDPSALQRAAPRLPTVLPVGARALRVARPIARAVRGDVLRGDGVRELSLA